MSTLFNKRKSQFAYRGMLLLVILSMLLAACSQQGNQTPTQSGAAGAPTTASTSAATSPTTASTTAPTTAATTASTSAATSAATTAATNAATPGVTATGNATAAATQSGAATPGATQANVKPASGSLSVLGFSLPDEIAKVRVDVFKKANPDVKLNLTEGNLDQQQFLTAVSSGKPPDVVYIDRAQLGTYASRGAIVPLDQCIKDQNIDMSQFREAAVGQVTMSGHVYGIPEFYNIIVLQANGAALKEVGLTPDDVSTTDWAKVNDLNNKLTKMQGGKVVRIGFDPKLPEFLPLWVKANGGQMLSDDGKKAMLDDPKVVEALTFAASLHKAAGGSQAFKAFRDTWDFFGAKNQFVSNQIGITPLEQWYINVLSDVSPNVDLVVKPFTDKTGKPITYVTGSAWAIPKGAANPDAACAFMRTMTDTATWTAAAQARADARAAKNQTFTGVYTANKKADEIIFGKIMKPSGNKAFDDAIKVVLSVQDNAFIIPSNPAGAEFQQAWQDAVNRVLNNEQTPDAALKQAQQEAQAALDAAWAKTK